MMEVLQNNISTTPVPTNYNHYDDSEDQQPSTMDRDTPVDQQQKPSSARSGRRGEAFLMTGEKMLCLNPKISPLYAAACQDQLPPEVEVASPLKPDESNNEYSDTFRSAGTLEEYESTPKRRINKQYQQNKDNSIESSKNSIITLPENAIHSLNEATFTKVPSFLNPKYMKSSNEPSTSGVSSPNTIDRTNNGKYDSGNGTSISLSVQLIDMDKLARIMYELNGYTRNDVTDILFRNDPNLTGINEKFYELFNFTGQRIDVGLRNFLDHVCLIGESSHRAALLESFANRYYECNPTLFENSDQVHTLTCSLILLNTDLHGENIGKKMTMREFISNLEHTDYSFEKQLLRSLYDSVKKEPFIYHDDGQSKPEVKVEKRDTITRRVSRKVSKKQSLICSKDEIDYNYGWVLTKSVYDRDGKPTPKGRRGWKMFYATVRGMILFLHKNEHGFEAGRFKTYQNCVPLYHSVASIATDYAKKQHVFRLRTANYSEFLFQTSNPQELNKWIDVINYVAAAFSAPTLPMPASADFKWVQRRPVLPSTPSNLTIPEQLKSHVSKVEEVNQAIEDLQKHAPKIQAKKSEVQNYFRVERLYLNERERYTLYVNILREKLHQASAASSRNNSTKILPMTKQASYITNIPISGNGMSSNGTITSSRGNGEGNTTIIKRTNTIDNKSAALAEAMAIADGRIPPRSVAGDSEYSNDSSYR